MPSEIPASLQFDAIVLDKFIGAGPEDLESCQASDTAEFYFSVTSSQKPLTIRLIQSLSQPDFSGREAESLGIDGKDVTKHTGSMNDSDETVFYAWQDEDVSYVLQVPGDSPVEEEALISMIASVG